VEALVGGSSEWHRFGTKPASIGADAMAGLKEAAYGYGQIASLVLPADVSWSEGGETAELESVEGPYPVDPAVVMQVADALKSGRKAVIILGNPAVVEELHSLLKGIADQTGAELMGSSTISNIPKGKG